MHFEIFFSHDAFHSINHTGTTDGLLHETMMMSHKETTMNTIADVLERELILHEIQLATMTKRTTKVLTAFNERRICTSGNQR